MHQGGMWRHIGSAAHPNDPQQRRASAARDRPRMLEKQDYDEMGAEDRHALAQALRLPEGSEARRTALVALGNCAQESEARAADATHKAKEHAGRDAAAPPPLLRQKQHKALVCMWHIDTDS